MRLAAALALVFGSAACGPGDSDNVMATSANALTPAQVDLALGPELPNNAVNAVNAVNAGNAVDSVNGADAAISENAVEAADTEDALDESVPEESESEPSAANNGLEQ